MAPFIQPSGSSLESPHKALSLPRESGTVLLVEMESSVRRLACEALKVKGYRVLLASTGAEALGVIKNHQDKAVCLLITDEVMPVMKGEILWDWLRKAYPQMKALFISDQINDDPVLQERWGKSVDRLAKPFTQRVLLQKVQALLDQESKPHSGVGSVSRGIVEMAYLELQQSDSGKFLQPGTMGYTPHSSTL